MAIQQPYVSGQHVESRLVVQLKDLGCKMTQSAELNHNYKLDFVINSFDGIHKLRPVGVQVTTRGGDRAKMREFLAVQRHSAYVDKTLYIELLHHGIEQGVDRLVYSTILQFLFSSSFTGVPVGAFRVRPDFSIEFFDLEAESRLPDANEPPPRPRFEGGPRNFEGGAPRSFDNAARFWDGGPPRPRYEAQPAVPASPDLPVGAEVSGFIRVVFNKGYGFIDCEPHPSHFFPFAKVITPALREHLQILQRRSNPSVDGLKIPVKFTSLGKTRAGDKASPQADRIELTGEIPTDAPDPTPTDDTAPLAEPTAPTAPTDDTPQS